MKFSGIVSILFCGIIISRYSLLNLNEKSFEIVNKLCSTVSELFEKIAFLIIGVSVFAFEYPLKDIGFLNYFVCFCILLIARFFNIYILSFIINKSKKKYIS